MKPGMSSMDTKAQALFEAFQRDGSVKVTKSAGKGIVAVLFSVAVVVVCIVVGVAWIGRYEPMYLLIPFGLAAVFGWALLQQVRGLSSGDLEVNLSGFRIGTGPVVEWDSIQRYKVDGARTSAAARTNFAETVTVERVPGSNPAKVRLPESLQIPSTSLAAFMQACHRAATARRG